MAQLVGVRNRGRKPGALRVAAREMAAKVKGGNAKEFTIEVLAQSGRKKAESITVELPAGCAIVPVGLTADKSEENAREQLRLAIEDAGRKGEVGVKSVAFITDAGDPGIVWVMVERKPAAKPAPKPKPKAKGK